VELLPFSNTVIKVLKWGMIISLSTHDGKNAQKYHQCANINMEKLKINKCEAQMISGLAQKCGCKELEIVVKM
jgi:hypothetical protein